MFRDSSIIRWRKYKDRYMLVGFECASCGKKYFEEKGLCPCGATEFNEIEFSGKGKIVSFTQIHSGPEAFTELGKYNVAIIDLDEGARITAQIADAKYEDLKIGQNVEAVFRKFYKSGEKGAIHYGTKFVPIF